MPRAAFIRPGANFVTGGVIVDIIDFSRSGRSVSAAVRKATKKISGPILWSCRACLSGRNWAVLVRSGWNFPCDAEQFSTLAWRIRYSLLY